MCTSGCSDQHCQWLKHCPRPTRSQCRHIRLSLLQLWTESKLNPNWSADRKAFPGLLSTYLPYQNLQKTTEICRRQSRAWRPLFYEQAYLMEGLIFMHGIFSSLTQFFQTSKQEKEVPMGTSEAAGGDDILW